jgi:HlyD family secretion protein
MSKALGLGVMLVLSVVALAVWYAPEPPPSPDLTASGTVEATEAQLGFTTGGRLAELTVQEGDQVRTDQAIAHLDDAEIFARRAQAVAQVASARAGLVELRQGARTEEVAQARARVTAMDERLLDAERDRDRTRALFEGGAVSREALDKAGTAVEIARSQIDQATEQLRLVEAGPRAARIDVQRAQVAQAEAAVRTLDVLLANTTITAPFDGIVTVRHREPGEIVPPGSAVVTVMNPDDRWVRIYVPEPRIGAVHLGMQATISSDTYAAKRYGGEVTHLASEAEFTPRSVQTTEERVRLVYAAKVRILDDPALELKPGMPADVHLAIDP